MMTRLCWLASLVATLALARADLPAELAAALADFRTEGSKGWAFTQVTEADGKSLIERFDPAQPDFQRWTLLEKDGRPPTAAELVDYREKQTRRTGGLPAPNVKDQLNPDGCSLVSEDAIRSVWRCGLVPGAPDDTSAAHMNATFTVHRPTGTIERVELANFEPFSPVFLVRVQEARTVMNYLPPTDEEPTRLDRITMRVRGTAMWFKSLDSDLTVTYRDYVYAGKVVP